MRDTNERIFRFVAYCTDKWLDAFTSVYFIKYRTGVCRWPSSSRQDGAAAAGLAAAEILIPKKQTRASMY